MQRLRGEWAGKGGVEAGGRGRLELAISKGVGDLGEVRFSGEGAGRARSGAVKVGAGS